VLPLYASGTVTAMDFLMKDMGEDRWFCTLLVEAGWKLEYCAASKDSTFAPMEFEEYFKQRRRWGPSTLANSMVVLQKQSAIRRNNDSINLMFVVYQFVLIMSSIIGPGTVLLIVAGGLNYCYGTSMVTVMVLEIIITIAFTLCCLFCTQDTQLKVAKWLTFLSAIIMAIVTVGLITQCVDNMAKFRELLNNRTASKMVSTTVAPTQVPPNGTLLQPYVTTSSYSDNFYDIPLQMIQLFSSPQHTNGTEPLDFQTILNVISPASLYLMVMVALYIFTALLHPSEFFNLIHGLWYFLCLPSGSLLLQIYSVVNLTDRSWGE
jgi:chitin synthase